MKTSRDRLKAWMRNINQYYASLMYTTSLRDLENNGKQHTYTRGVEKFVFEYYQTGRIVVKTKNLPLLQKEFVANHESVLGVKLEMIGPLQQRAQSQSQSLIPVSKRNIHSATERLQLNRSHSASLTSTSSHHDEGVRKLTQSTSQIADEPAPACDHAVAFRNQENEVCLLRNEVRDLKAEVLRMREEMREMVRRQTFDTKQVGEVVRKMNQVVIAHAGSIVNHGNHGNHGAVGADLGSRVDPEVHGGGISNGGGGDGFGVNSASNDIGGDSVVGGGMESYSEDNASVLSGSDGGYGEMGNSGSGASSHDGFGGGSGVGGGVGGGGRGSIDLKEVNLEERSVGKKAVPMKKVSVRYLTEHYQNLYKIATDGTPI